MHLFICVISVTLLEFANSQMLPFVPSNAEAGQLVANQPTPTQQLTNANAIRAVAGNNAVPRTGNLNIVNGIPYIAHNLPNAHMPNAIDHAFVAAHHGPHVGLSNANIGLPNANIGLPNANIGLTNANLGLANANALANVANINGNMATFNLGNGGFTVASGSPGCHGFGIQVLADALEVGGKLAVNGQMPIFGAVSLNGQLPTDGSAAVSYKCGGQRDR